mmetsp:Transcript_29631/g.47708  ORF Transcript_29631/g.47708 Transcript_29631/m.47708 type:complete len:629 (-) Transcript_29631:712-2598(-)
MNVQQPASKGSTVTSQGMSLQAPSFERGFSGMTGFGGNNFGTGFERLSSAPFTPGMMDKLGGANTEFSRLASLGNFAAAQNNAFARVSSTVSNIQGDAFTRAASSFIPFPNHGFERVSSLAGSIVPQLQSDQHNGVDANGKAISGPMSGISGGMMAGFARAPSLSMQAGFARAPSLGQSVAGGTSAGFTRAPSLGQGMQGLPFGLFQHGQQGGLVGGPGKGMDGMGHMGQMGMAQTPAGRDMGMAWQRTMSGASDMFVRTGSATGGFPSMMGQGQDGGGLPQQIMGHWDPSALGGGGGNVPMEMWGMQHGMAHHPGMHGFGFGHEHMALMPPAMYAPHGLQMAAPMQAGMMAGRPQEPLDMPQDGKGKKGRGKNKPAKLRANDPQAGARKKRKAEKREGGGSGGEGDEDGQGFEKHNQFLWAKRMGQQNEPRWGLFKQGGSAGPAFLKLLEQLEEEGIIERQFGIVPDTLGGVNGWTVKEGMMENWQRRRQAWFMEGKEGKEYKPNSLYQIMRRLGFFPTMRSSRAGHGHDFEGSTIFKWDSERKYSQRRHTKGGNDKDDDNQDKTRHELKPIPVAPQGMALYNNVPGFASSNGFNSIQHSNLQQLQGPLQNFSGLPPGVGMEVVKKL